MYTVPSYILGPSLAELSSKSSGDGLRFPAYRHWIRVVAAHLSKTSGLVRSKSSNGPYSIWPGSGLVHLLQCSTVYCISILMQYNHSTLWDYVLYYYNTLQWSTILGDRPYSKIFHCSNFTVWYSRIQFTVFYTTSSTLHYITALYYILQLSITRT